MRIELSDIIGQPGQANSNPITLTEAMDYHYIINGLLTSLVVLQAVEQADVFNISSLAIDIVGILGTAAIVIASRKASQQQLDKWMHRYDNLSTGSVSVVAIIANDLLKISAASAKVGAGLAIASSCAAFAAAAHAWISFGYSLVELRRAYKKCCPEALVEERLEKYQLLQQRIDSQEESAESKKIIQIEQQQLLDEALAIAKVDIDKVDEGQKASQVEKFQTIFQEKQIPLEACRDLTQTPSANEKVVADQIIEEQTQQVIEKGKTCFINLTAAVSLTVLAIATVMAVPFVGIAIAAGLTLFAVSYKASQLRKIKCQQAKQEEIFSRHKNRILNQYLNDKGKMAIVERVIGRLGPAGASLQMEVTCRLAYEKYEEKLLKKYLAGYKEDYKKQIEKELSQSGKEMKNLSEIEENPAIEVEARRKIEEDFYESLFAPSFAKQLDSFLQNILNQTAEQSMLREKIQANEQNKADVPQSTRSRFSYGGIFSPKKKAGPAIKREGVTATPIPSGFSKG